MQVNEENYECYSTDPRDREIHNRIEHMSEDEKEQLRLTYSPNSIRHYNNEQKEWFITQQHLMRDTLGREPTTEEIIENAIKYKNMERFRIFYILKFMNENDENGVPRLIKLNK